MNKKIGIFPSNELRIRKKLFNALEMVFYVKFLDFNKKQLQHYDAIIFFGNNYKEYNLYNIKALIYEFNLHDTPNEGGYIFLRNVNQLDSRLHNQSIYDSRSKSLKSINVKSNDIILATSNNQSVWIKRKNKNNELDIVSLPPDELHNNLYELYKNDRFIDFYGTLRYQLNEERFFSYLPLIHFLREVTSKLLWTPPILRATFVIDDPNLHLIKYGYLNYPEIIKHAKINHYHVVIAIIPLDLWWASKKAISLFKNNASFISLTIHGTNHNEELLLTKQNEILLIAQALRRVNKFENKYHLPISRVIIPPHERFSKETCKALIRLGVEALCNSRPFGWFSIDKSLPSLNNPIIGWYPADFVVGGLPVITRRGAKSDIILRAFLDQPIIQYIHHTDLASGLEILSDISKKINDLGNVEWTSLESIARTNYLTKKEGNILRIKMLSRNINVIIPDDVNKLEVEIPHIQGVPSNEYISINNTLFLLKPKLLGKTTNQISLSQKTSYVNISLITNDAIDYNNTISPKFELNPYIRRFLTEARDRFSPIFSK